MTKLHWCQLNCWSNWQDIVCCADDYKPPVPHSIVLLQSMRTEEQRNLFLCDSKFSTLKYTAGFSCRYNVNLKEAKKNGIRKGLFIGGSLGFVFFLQFCAFSLAFWYGAKLVREQPENYDGGNIITVSRNQCNLFLMLRKPRCSNLGTCFPSKYTGTNERSHNDDKNNSEKCNE